MKKIMEMTMPFLLKFGLVLGCIGLLMALLGWAIETFADRQLRKLQKEHK